MHFIFLRQCFYGLLLFNGFNANFTFKFGSKFSAACFTHPDRSFRLQISILFTCLKNGEYYTIGIRLNNSIMDERNSSKINYHLIPELMFGISRKLMVSGNIFFSNRSEVFRAEGGSLYMKYRFLSNDAIQKHFRMAGFGRISYNNSDIHQEEINMNGHNTGTEIGVVATQLLRRIALSSSISFLKAVDNGNDNKFAYGLKESK